MSAWIGLAGTVVGAAIAGVLLYFRDSAQRTFSRQAERRALVIDKYERLYRELTDIDSSIGNLAVDLIGVASLGDKIDLGQYTSKIPLSSALMYAEFYAPQILPNLQPLQPKLAEFYQVIFKLSTSRTASDSERLALAESGMEISHHVKQIVRAANEALAKLARDATHGQ